MELNPLQASDPTDDFSVRGPARIDPASQTARLQVEYRAPALRAAQGAAVLAQVRFDANPGAPTPASGPLTIDVRLAPVHAAPLTELWYASGSVHGGCQGSLRFAYDAHFLFAVVEEDERIHGGVRAATQAAYAAIRRFQSQSGFPHLLRVWNYLDAINDGSGDLERYRQFCVGRAQGLGESAGMAYPAATAIGRQHSTHQLQVFWLAGRHSGRAVENPRQVSAYRYPRVHGPVSPSFSRATLAEDGTLLISGTASIVGHLSRHHGNPAEQLEETLRNLAALAQQAQKHTGAPLQQSLLKVYVRDPALVPPLAARLKQLYPHSEALFLAADICRRELLLEIESVCRP